MWLRLRHHWWCLYLLPCLLTIPFSFCLDILMENLQLHSTFCFWVIQRYREALLSGWDNTKSVEIMLSSAGHTITVSGITLAGMYTNLRLSYFAHYLDKGTFMGLAILPMELLRTLGLGSAVSILITLLVNLTLTPSLLLAFRGFFSGCIQPVKCFGRLETTLSDVT